MSQVAHVVISVSGALEPGILIGKHPLGALSDGMLL